MIEFGRPACEASGIRVSKKDSLGRRIGYIHPHSHIRAAVFQKRDAVLKDMVKLIDDAIKERFGGK